MKSLNRNYHGIYLIVLLILCSFNNLLAQTNKSLVSYSIEVPKQVIIGEQFTITVVFNIQPNWYVYAPVDFNIAQGKIPTKVTFRVPAKLKSIGSLELPDQKGGGIYKGNGIRMSQKFEVEKSMEAGKYIIKTNIIYQTCNDDICYPPIRESVDIEINVTK